MVWLDDRGLAWSTNTTSEGLYTMAPSRQHAHRISLGTHLQQCSLMPGQVLPGGQEVDVLPGDGQLVVMLLYIFLQLLHS